MPKLSDLYPSKFLTKEDIGAGQLFTIRGVSIENVGREDDPETKPVLHFAETPKPLVLNKTNGQVVGALYGEDTDAWVNKQVVVYFDPTIQFQGKMTGGIRLRAPKGVGPSADLPF